MNLADIKRKRPVDLTVEEVAYLVEEIEELRAAHREAIVKARTTGEVLVVDACGIEQFKDRRDICWGSNEPGPPRSFVMPVRRRLEPFFQAESVPAAEVMQRREFVLAGRLSWNGVYVYEEKV